MPDVYSTQELIEILAAEREACLRGDRLNLRASPFIGNAAVDRWLDPSAMQKFAAFQDFREQVHHYQRDQKVSGLVWCELTVNDRCLRFPRVHDHLIALESDLARLGQAKEEILQFWLEATEGMSLFLGLQGGKRYEWLDREAVWAIDRRAEWADIWMSEGDRFLQVVLLLGWGLPQEAMYRRGSSRSGCEYLYAVRPGQLPIG
jgi:hypothetical protein